MKKHLLFGFVLACVSLHAAAAEPASQRSGFNPNRLYFGGGVGLNSVTNSDNALGMQIFGGYNFGEVARNIVIDTEVGYMDTGNMRVDTPFGRANSRAKGLWASGVGRLSINPQIDLLLRLGYDFGDDDGVLFGVGGGYNLNRQTQARLEYVQRNNVDSLQLNFAFFP